MEELEKYLKMFAENPELGVEFVSGMINEYKPIAYKLLNEFFGMYKDFVDNEDYWLYTAKAQMNYYQALVHMGFTEEQAFTLLLDNETRKQNLAKTGKKFKIDTKD